jgi:pyocin large subunit-like protein
VSFDAIRWALRQEPGKSPTKFVLVAMAEFVNAESAEWVCWPSYRAIASVTLQDTKTVEAAVYRLKQLGLIVDTGQRKGETGKVIVYRLNDPKLVSLRKDFNLPTRAVRDRTTTPKPEVLRLPVTTPNLRLIPPNFQRNPPNFPW